MSTETLTLRRINRATLARQMLLARERIAPLRAIERLVAMQAQWPRPPFLGLWTRVEGFEREQLTSLFLERKAVRATFLRATIHVVSAKDFVALRPAIQPALDAAMEGILRERLDGIDLDRLLGRARALLAEEPLTFDALRDRFLREDPKVDERAMGYAVRMRLPLVQVPVDGAAWAFPSQASFAPADAWLGGGGTRAAAARKTVSRASAKADAAAAAERAASADPDPLVLRYLAAYGPASAEDIRAWSGLPRQAVRDVVERLRPRLQVFRPDTKPVSKLELFDLPDAPRPHPDVPAPVRLVPEYDNLITTRADERFVARAHRPRVFLSALRIAATVLVDGFVAGTWKVTATKKLATIAIEPFATFPAAVRKQVEAEADALVRFAEPDARAFDVKIAKA